MKKNSLSKWPLANLVWTYFSQCVNGVLSAATLAKMLPLFGTIKNHLALSRSVSESWSPSRPREPAPCGGVCKQICHHLNVSLSPSLSLSLSLWHLHVLPFHLFVLVLPLFPIPLSSLCSSPHSLSHSLTPAVTQLHLLPQTWQAASSHVSFLLSRSFVPRSPWALPVNSTVTLFPLLPFSSKLSLWCSQILERVRVWILPITFFAPKKRT